MDINHKTIDNKTRGEVGALFQGYVVQPLTEELQTKLEKAASDENGQFEAVKEELGTVKRAVTLTDWLYRHPTFSHMQDQAHARHR